MHDNEYCYEDDNDFHAFEAFEQGQADKPRTCITREFVDRWLEVNRPHLLTYATPKQMGVYRSGSSPSQTFIPYGKTWRAVYSALNKKD